jgi:PAS domain S-box-containing protein
MLPLKSIKSRYYLVFFFLLLSICFSYLSFFYVQDWGRAKAQAYSSSQLLNTVTAVRSAINKFHVLPFLVSKQTDVQALLKNNNFKDLVRVRNYLEQTAVISGAASVLVLNNKGKVTAHSDWREKSKLMIENYAQSPFFVDAIKGEEGSGVWFGETNGVGFYFSAPIYSSQTLIGVAVVRIDVAKALENTMTREDFFLTNSMGDLVYSNENTNAEVDTHLPSHQLNSLKPITLLDGTRLNIKKMGGHSFLVQQVLLDDTLWSIGIVTTLKVDKNAYWSALGAFSFCILLILLLMYIREWRAKKRSQRQVIAAQLESELRGRHIINTAQSGLITLDAKGCITFINPLVMQQFGISLNSVIKQPLSILFDQPAKFTSLNRVLDSLEKTPNASFSPLTGYEVVAKRSDGSMFPAMFSIKQMRSNPVAEYLVTLVDISKRKKLERSLKEVNESLEDKVKRRTIALEMAQEELLNAEKMVVLGRMSTALVHEISQPLTALRNYLAIIDKVKGQPDLMDQPLNALNHLVDNMTGITRQLKMFAYARFEPQEQLELVSIIEGVLLIVNPELVKHNVNIVHNLSELKVFVLADKIKLEQVLHNLLGNAIDAMASQSQKQVNIALSVDQMSVYLVISDTGGGVNDEQLKRIFEPFYTTKDIGMGLGLGLSIVKNIIEDLHGSITAQNTDKGIAFTLTLPLLVAKDRLATV